MNTLKPLDAQTPLAERRTLIAEFLAWLADPATQDRQITGHLYDTRGGCCAMGGLGEVLIRHGYADRDGASIEMQFRNANWEGDDRYRSTLHLTHAALDALGLEHLWRHIVTLNDEERLSFREIGVKLAELGLHAPEAGVS